MSHIGRVLLITDDTALNETVSEFLSSSEFDVVSESSLETGLDAVKNSRFDTVIFDTRLGRSDNEEFLVQARLHDHTLEIIVITDEDIGQTNLATSAKGSCTHLQRPVHLPALLNHVQSAVTSRAFHRHIDHLVKSSGAVSTPLGKYVHTLERLLRFDRNLMAVLDYRRVVDVILNGMLEVCEADVVCMLITHERISTATVQGRPATIHPAKTDLFTRMVTNWETWGGKPITKDALLWAGIDESSTTDIKDALIIPLMAHDSLIGAIGAFTTTSGMLAPDAEVLGPFVAGRAEIVVENVFMHEHTKILATTDALTGLLNRRVFLDGLAREFERARRSQMSNKEGGELSLIMLDVDHFKKFNDTYGHQLGDKVLKSVANVLMNGARRAPDIAARYGGEEFVVLLPDTSLENAALLAERLRNQLERTPVESSSGDLHVTASFGVSSFPECGAESTEELIEQSDTAQYEAKRTGRNKVCIAEPVRHHDVVPAQTEA